LVLLMQSRQLVAGVKDLSILAQRSLDPGHQLSTVDAT
jgi:hypothetical protein